MTYTQTLIAKLRDTASQGISAWGDLQQEAADELATLTAIKTTHEDTIRALEDRLSEAQVMANTDHILIMHLAEQLSAERLATEIEATERQVEILTDALAESRLEILAEREACAKVCDYQASRDYWEGAHACARNIRARGQA